MIHFVGAGSGAADLITVRGQRLLSQADVVIYAGSLVNPALLEETKEGCEIFNSAEMTLEQVVQAMEKSQNEGLNLVRLHTGDPSIYGAIGEQMAELNRLGLEYDVCPGVSSFCGAAAALRAEYTLPGISQTVILTRLAGRTPVPVGQDLKSLSAHGATIILFLSANMLQEASRQLISGGYRADTPAAIVYKATWPEEEVIYTTVGNLEQAAQDRGIYKTALVTVGDFLGGEFDRSKLYDPDFTTQYRKGTGVGVDES